MTEARKYHYDWLIKKGTEHTPAHFLAYSTNGDTHEMMQAYADKVKLEHTIEVLDNLYCNSNYISCQHSKINELKKQLEQLKTK